MNIGKVRNTMFTAAEGGVVGSRLEIYMIVTESIRGDYRERGGHMRVPSAMLS